jgi:hypothetical protein
VVVGTALLLSSRPGWAREPLDLSWTAPAECPFQTEIAADVLRLRASGGPLPPLQAIAVVTREASGAWSVTIKTASDAGTSTRSMTGESCATLAQAAALYLALALESPGAVPATESTVSQPPPAPPSIAPVSETAPLTVRARRDLSTGPAATVLSHLSLGASLRVDGATLPRPVIGGELSGAWRQGDFRFEAAGTYWRDQRALLSQGPTTGGDFAMVGAALRACAQHRGASLTIGPCVALNVDHVRGVGYGALEAAGGSTTWPGGGLGVIAALRFARWGQVRALADANVPFSRPRFIVVNSDGQHRPAVVSARFGIGLELAIP